MNINSKIVKWALGPIKNMVKKWILNKLEENRESIINRSLNITIPGVSGELQEAIVTGFYNEIEKDIKLILDTI